LRQQFAIQLIGLLQDGKTLLNFDETWLGVSDFRR
jgi:transposase